MEVVLNTLLSHGSTGCKMALLAYIDPSTGSLVFQVVAASAISAGLFVRGLRERIVWLFTGGWRARGQHGSASRAEQAAENTRVEPARELPRKAA